jgi:putative endonuclease
MAHVYVLKSLKNGKRYVGYTTKAVHERLKQHQSGSTKWTKHNGPFEIVYTEEVLSASDARKREIFLKSGQGRKFLDEILKSN